MTPYFSSFFPFVFIAGWILTLYGLAKSGWREFSERFNAYGNFSGTRGGTISARIKKIQYNGSLIIRFDAQGIYLRPLLIFRLFHKPVFVPWSGIKETRAKKLSFSRVHELIIGDHGEFVLILSRRVFKKIEQYVDLYKITSG